MHPRFIYFVKMSSVTKSKLTKVFKSQSRIRKGNLPESTIWNGDVEKFLDALPATEKFDLIISSPPYNIGKPYEQKTELKEYVDWQRRVIGKCLDHLSDTGSICWQVGNFLEKGKTSKESAILPLDFLFFEIFKEFGLKLRNRIIWHFGHGLHCRNRFSGRYEVVLWFTKGDKYYFDLDSVRVSQKYPGKRHFKGPKAGKLSGNPKGKNPEDLWKLDVEQLSPWEKTIWDVPNVKSNHVEKTTHPCQFPVALVDRFVLSMSPPEGKVFDPFAGVCSAGVAALLNGRRFVGCEIDENYLHIGKHRLNQAITGTAKFRPFDKPIYDHRISPLSRQPE